MKYWGSFAAIAAVALVAAPAAAQDRAESEARITAGVTGGTLGIGPEASVRLTPMVGVRGNATFLKVSRGVDSDGVDYDGDLKLGTAGLMVDFHPGGGGFRLSGGLRFGRNKVALSATPTEAVEVGDDTYTPAEVGVLSGDISARKVSPTLTLGWAGNMSRGLKFSVEAGAMFQGSPKVRDLTATGTLRSNAAFQASLLRERQEVEDDIDNYKVYPILQLGLGYRF